MPDYTTKPNTIKAVLHLGNGHFSFPDGVPEQWVTDAMQDGRLITLLDGSIQVTTIESNKVVLKPGAMLVRDTRGGIYPCDADVFNDKYVLVED